MASEVAASGNGSVSATRAVEQRQFCRRLSRYSDRDHHSHWSSAARQGAPCRPAGQIPDQRLRERGIADALAPRRASPCRLSEKRNVANDQLCDAGAARRCGTTSSRRTRQHHGGATVARSPCRFAQAIRALATRAELIPGAEPRCRRRQGARPLMSDEDES